VVHVTLDGQIYVEGLTNSGITSTCLDTMKCYSLVSCWNSAVTDVY
jgi:hypothetical protein